MTNTSDTINKIDMQDSESPNPPPEHVLTPETPTGGFTVSGVGSVQQHLTNTRTRDDMNQEYRGNLRGWTEILNALEKVKVNARLWQSQTDRLDTKIAMLDAVTHDLMSDKKSIEEKNQDLSTELAKLHLDLEAQQGECRFLRETVASLKRDLVSEEQARRRLEKLHDAKEIEWSSSKARMHMEMELSKSLLAMQKEAELQQHDSHVRAVESFRCTIDNRDAEMKEASKTIEHLRSSGVTLKGELQATRSEADKHREECNEAKRKSTALADQLERNQKRYDEDMKRTEEIFQSHTEAHKACLHMKDVEISSLKELGQSLQREYESKVSHLETQNNALEDTISQWRKRHESLSKKYDQQCADLAEVQCQHEALKVNLDAVTDTVKTLQNSESAQAVKIKDLQTSLRQEKTTREDLEKKMHQELEEERAITHGLQATKSLLESQLAENSQKFDSLLKSHEDLKEKFDILMKTKKASVDENEEAIPAVRPAAKRVLQKRMKFSQRKTTDAQP